VICLSSTVLEDVLLLGIDFMYSEFGHPICYCLLSVNIAAIDAVNHCTIYNERYPNQIDFVFWFILSRTLVTHFALDYDQRKI
jgi:hypothetical protein